MKFLVVNGANINMLGIREPGIYGRDTYASLIAKIEDEAKRLGVDVECFQSNHEGALVDVIQNAYGRFKARGLPPDQLRGHGLPLALHRRGARRLPPRDARDERGITISRII